MVSDPAAEDLSKEVSGPASWFRVCVSVAQLAPTASSGLEGGVVQLRTLAFCKNTPKRPLFVGWMKRIFLFFSFFLNLSSNSFYNKIDLEHLNLLTLHLGGWADRCLPLDQGELPTDSCVLLERDTCLLQNSNNSEIQKRGFIPIMADLDCLGSFWPISISGLCSTWHCPTKTGFQSSQCY